jgi:hypothetical protein
VHGFIKAPPFWCGQEACTAFGQTKEPFFKGSARLNNYNSIFSQGQQNKRFS